MDRKTLRKVQLAQVVILDEIHRICQKHQITYYLAGGTLIGAARHKGFIPWDDDLDISMPRSEYNRFMEVCKVELNDMFELQSVDLEPKYNLFIAKVRLKNTRLVDRIIASLDINQGIYIDIFPLDQCDTVDWKLKLRAKTFGFCAKLKSAKLGIEKKGSFGKNVLVVCAKAFVFFIPLKWLNQITQKILTCKKNGSMYVNFCSQYGYRKQTMPKEWFGNGTSITFEGKQYQVPREYKKVLTSIYGDYMKLPPEDKQKTVHDFIEVDLGPYEYIIKERIEDETI